MASLATIAFVASLSFVASGNVATRHGFVRNGTRAEYRALSHHSTRCDAMCVLCKPCKISSTHEFEAKTLAGDDMEIAHDPTRRLVIRGEYVNRDRYLATLPTET